MVEDIFYYTHNKLGVRRKIDRYQIKFHELTGRLIEYAKKAECDYTVDLFFRYGSDAGASMRSGNNLKIGLFGMPVYGSHCMERTHVDGLAATTNRALAYILDI